MEKKRNLVLQPRKEHTREKKPITVTNFDLTQIVAHFDDNLFSLRRHYKLADELASSGQFDEAKDIWRTQIVFLESALDFYIHEITKFGMNKIFNNEWDRTTKFDSYRLRLSDVLYITSNPEDTSWFVNHVNDTIMSETFMDHKSIKDQLQLLGINEKTVANKAFYVLGSTDKTIEQFKRHLNRIFKRRNDIVHQSDRNHFNGEHNDITREYVEQEIQHIEKIVHAINECIVEKISEVISHSAEDEVFEG